MNLEKEIKELKDALKYVIFDYKFLALRTSNTKISLLFIAEILEDHKAMAKRWKLETTISE